MRSRNADVFSIASGRRPGGVRHATICAALAAALLATAVCLTSLAGYCRATDTEQRDFAIFVDGKEVGQSSVKLVQQEDGSAYLNATVNVQVRALLKYTLAIKAQEWWKGGRLVGLKTSTDENGKKTEVLVADGNNNQLKLRVNTQERWCATMSGQAASGNSPTRAITTSRCPCSTWTPARITSPSCNSSARSAQGRRGSAQVLPLPRHRRIIPDRALVRSVPPPGSSGVHRTRASHHRHAHRRSPLSARLHRGRQAASPVRSRGIPHVRS